MITENDDHRADHHDFAVREVDELDDAVDHRVAERDDGVDAAERQAVDHLLQEDVQRLPVEPALRFRRGRRRRLWRVRGREPAIPSAWRAAGTRLSRAKKTAPRRTPFSLQPKRVACAGLTPFCRPPPGPGAIAGAAAGAIAGAAAGAPPEPPPPPDACADLRRLAGLDDRDRARRCRSSSGRSSFRRPCGRPSRRTRCGPSRRRT